MDERKLAIMQPYLFPYLGYYQLAAASDKFIFLDDVAFIKGGWINRNRIFGDVGTQLITIPLSEASQNKQIRQIKTRPQREWRPKLLKKIEFTYRKAPHFNEVFPVVADVLNVEEIGVDEVAIRSIVEVMKYLELPFEHSRSSELNVQDFKAEQKILRICELEGAATYINPIGGTELYSAANFESRNLNLQFIKMDSISYLQFGKPSTEALSMIDVLMFNGRTEARNLFEQFTLIDG